MKKILLMTAALASAPLLTAGCSNPDCTVDEGYAPTIDPADFSSEVDNPLFPLVPGTTYTFESEDETVEVVVTEDTRVILGVTTVAVRDTVTADGELVEDTIDWYAQDDAGNVWYFGEDTREFENGEVVSTRGSWEAGVDGAFPGIIMHATQPALGVAYRQEYAPCEAEDFGSVQSLDASVSVPAGDFTGCVQTRDTTPLEPSVSELKYYCPGVGLVLEEDEVTGGRTELIEVTSP